MSLPPIRAVPRDQIEEYELIGELAAGGMGVIYLARRVGAAGFERVVVIKRIHRHLLAEDPEVARLLLMEARLTEAIHHPNVVGTVDVVEANGEIALVFEYVEALSLSTLLRAAGPLPPPIAARIACDTLFGLEAAHVATDVRGNLLGIVHRDISPQNILVGRDGVTRLIDFGIAKASAQAAKTTSLSIRGKLLYMSPEQLAGRPMDGRSDVFSFGIVLFQMLFGRSPYPAAGDAQLAFMVLMADEPELPAHTPVGLAAILRKALARSPDERFLSAGSFERALSAQMPVASHHDVKTFVASLFGKSFDERKRVIAQLVTEPRPRLSSADAVVAPQPPALASSQARTMTEPRGGHATLAIVGVVAAAAVLAIVLVAASRLGVLRRTVPAGDPTFTAASTPPSSATSAPPTPSESTARPPAVATSSVALPGPATTTTTTPTPSPTVRVLPPASAPSKIRPNPY